MKIEYRHPWELDGGIRGDDKAFAFNTIAGLHLSRKFPGRMLCPVLGIHSDIVFREVTGKYFCGRTADMEVDDDLNIIFL